MAIKIKRIMPKLLSSHRLVIFLFAIRSPPLLRTMKGGVRPPIYIQIPTPFADNGDWKVLPQSSSEDAEY